MVEVKGLPKAQQDEVASRRPKTASSHADGGRGGKHEAGNGGRPKAAALGRRHPHDEMPWLMSPGR